MSCQLAAKHGSAGDLFHRQPAINWIFTQTNLSSIYRRKFLCLDEASRVAYNSDETQTNKILLLFGRDRLYGEILASVWQEELNFEVLKRCYVQIHPANFLLCYGKTVDLQHM